MIFEETNYSKGFRSLLLNDQFVVCSNKYTEKEICLGNVKKE